LNKPGVTPTEFLFALAPTQQYFLPPKTDLLAPLDKLDLFFAMAVMDAHNSLPSELIDTTSSLGSNMKRG
jgi:hypothetical protein